MMLQSIDKKIKLFFYLITFILLSTQITKDQNNNKKTKININQFEVFGLSSEENFKILQDLQSLKSKNIFFLEKKIFYKILEKNNLIDSFNIKKFYPNLIKINIQKTEFLAVTSKNNKKYYIGSNGKLIFIDKNKNINKKLPFVFTTTNYESFIKLKNIIDKSKFKFEKIESFYYFPSNRWDIKVDDGVLIKLPEKKILESLEIAYMLKASEEFKENNIIDLRINNKIVISNE